MTDFLLVHGAGQSAWVWGQVWGRLNAPPEHPPVLHRPRAVGKVTALDLPGHGLSSNGAARAVTLEQCVEAVVQAVPERSARQTVLVGHGFAAPILLRAAVQMTQPPKRLVLIAGIIPSSQEAMISVFPRRVRQGFQALSIASRWLRQPLRMPRLAVARYWGSGLSPQQLAQAVGRLGPLPETVLRTQPALAEVKEVCPITYVVLNQGKLLTAALQKQMAQRLSNPEIVELETGHQAMLQQPKELAALLLRYA